MQQETLTPRAIRPSDIAAALGEGLRVFKSAPGVSIAYAGIFAAIVLMLIAALSQVGISSMALPFAGGFLLLGPALLVGFFGLMEARLGGRTPALADAFTAFRGLPGGFWLMGLLCGFLFLIWITDAAVLYSFMIGAESADVDSAVLPGKAIRFHLWAAPAGAVLAYIIYCVSAFAVPLLYQGRCDLVRAVHASVRAVLGNFLATLAWGLLLSIVTLLSILLLPLLPVTLPILGYASFSLYRRTFPATGPTPPTV